MTPAQRRELVDRQHGSLSIVRQCALLGVSRSSLYHRPKETSQQALSLMREMDRQYLETPFYGSRRMKASLDRQGMPVSRKRVQRLMRLMGLRAIYRQPRTSQPAPERRVYPYLLSRIVQVGGASTKSVMCDLPDSGRCGLSHWLVGRCSARGQLAGQLPVFRAIGLIPTHVVIRPLVCRRRRENVARTWFGSRRRR